MQPGVCHRCGEYGHFARDCPFNFADPPDDEPPRRTRSRPPPYTPAPPQPPEVAHHGAAAVRAALGWPEPPPDGNGHPWRGDLMALAAEQVAECRTRQVGLPASATPSGEDEDW